jgi:hypothetical protein
MLHRISLLAATVVTALAVAVTPAMAGEDTGVPPAPPPPAPAPTLTPAPAPPPPAPKPKKHKKHKKHKKQSSEGSESKGSSSGSNSGGTTRSYTTTVRPVVRTYTIPKGGVQAGGGGTAQQGSEDVLPVGLGLIGLTLAATAGGFALRRRHVNE